MKYDIQFFAHLFKKKTRNKKVLDGERKKAKWWVGILFSQVNDQICPVIFTPSKKKITLGNFQ